MAKLPACQLSFRRGLNTERPRQWQLAIALCLTVLCLTRPLSASLTFSEVSLPIERTLLTCDAAWADVDNDGDMDFVYTAALGGADTTWLTELMINTGRHRFIRQPVPALLQGASAPVIQWNDFDGDGDLDLLFGGHNPFIGYSTKLYRNDGGGSFIAMDEIDLHDSWVGSADWGDFDNDGDSDILIQGSGKKNRRTLIYQNLADNSFRELTIPTIPHVSQGTVAWGDYDSDGDLDALICGFDSAIMKVFQNTGHSFRELRALQLPGLNAAAAAWGDFDADGRLDFFFTGWPYPVSESIARLYRNTGNGAFSLIDSSDFLPVINPSVSWGDCDNDGDLDLLVTGARNGNGLHYTRLYVNKGNGNFEADRLAGMIGAFNGRAEWADFDNDGDLDILVAGWPGVLKLYRNNTEHPNSRAQPPTNLQAVCSDYSVSLTWNKGLDAETPQPGLSYNVRLSNADGREVLPAMADPLTGRRLIARIGNAGHNCFRLIHNLAPGSYRAAVQSIDNCWAGSAFSSEIEFRITGDGRTYVDPWSKFESAEQTEDPSNPYEINAPPLILEDLESRFK